MWAPVCVCVWEFCLLATFKNQGDLIYFSLSLNNKIITRQNTLIIDNSKSKITDKILGEIFEKNSQSSHILRRWRINH